MKTSHKDRNYFLSNKMLNQYHKELESVTKKKLLYLRSNLCVDDLSIAADIPVDYVKQVLSKKLNSTFFEFISKYKIGKAKRLLTKIDDNHFSISNVAIGSGFNTDESFIALFKKHTNLSPENYRIKYFNINPDSNNPVTDKAN